MTYKVTLSGKKEDARKAAEEASDANIKDQNQSEDDKARVLAIIDALPDGTLSGTIEDHNNGTVIVNVTSRADFAAAAVASAKVEASSDKKPPEDKKPVPPAPPKQ